MFDKLNQVAARYAQISESLMNPEIVSDQEQYKKLMKEHKQLSPLVEKYQEYDRAKADAAEAHELLEGGGLDKDFREMVEEELTASRKRMEELAEELKILLLPKDPNDDKSVVVEIRGGAGGEEAALFAAVLYRMYSMYAESQPVEDRAGLSASETELGGYKEISFMVDGRGRLLPLEI